MSDIFLEPGANTMRPAESCAAGGRTAMRLVRSGLERCGISFPITIPSPFYASRHWQAAPEAPRCENAPAGGLFRDDLDKLAPELSPMAAGPRPRIPGTELSKEQKALLRGAGMTPSGRLRVMRKRLSRLFLGGLALAGIRFPIVIPSPFYSRRSGEWARPDAGPRRARASRETFGDDLRRLAGQG